MAEYQVSLGAEGGLALLPTQYKEGLLPGYGVGGYLEVGRSDLGSLRLGVNHAAADTREDVSIDHKPWQRSEFTRITRLTLLANPNFLKTSSPGRFNAALLAGLTFDWRRMESRLRDSTGSDRGNPFDTDIFDEKDLGLLAVLEGRYRVYRQLSVVASVAVNETFSLGGDRLNSREKWDELEPGVAQTVVHTNLGLRVEL